LILFLLTNMYILNDFYSGLDKKVIYGSKCSKCDKVYFPPKIRCQDCSEQTEGLIELPNTGVLKNFIDSPISIKGKKNKNSQELYGLVQIDRSDTPIIMPLLNTTIDDLEAGMPVKVVWAKGKIIDSPHIVGFEPIKTK
ncbi:MAG: Zn-ribbon domain-containing OB-fold protein, partial [Candidatus Thorarchaeota archaeon]